MWYESAVNALEALAIFGAGAGAGTINSVVGSGTLITFPVLLAFGYTPVVANVSNTVGLVPGSLAGAYGYRRELAGQRDEIRRLGPVSVAGGLGGAALLLALPASAFRAIVPVFIAAALVLIVLQPRIAGALAARRAANPERRRAWPLLAGVFACSVYGGYFGAAQGILLLATLALSLDDTLVRINALRNVLVMLVNLVAGIVFAAVGDIAWGPAGLIAAGAIVGGLVGARIGRNLPPIALRAVIVVVGVIAIVKVLA